MEIRAIRANDIQLTNVIVLGKRNSKTLGLFPRNAFIEHANKNNIIGVIEDSNLLGYILFRLTQSKGIVNITHLCIDEKHRKRGVTKLLLDSVRDRYKNIFRGIALSCREDYTDASKMWEKYGFVARERTRSRSKNEKYLIKWWYDFGNVDLFSSIKLETTKINAVLDSSVIIKLSDNATPDRSEVSTLYVDWLIDDVDYYVAPEIYNEINRDKDKERADKTKTFIKKYTNEFQCKQDQKEAILSELSIFLTGTTDNHISDRKQLAESIVAAFSHFITLDSKLLKESDRIFADFGIRTIRPAEFILHIDQLKNRASYDALRLAGANYDYKKIDATEISVISSTFLQVGEKKSNLANIISDSVAKFPDSIQRTVKDKNNSYLGFFIADIQEDTLLIHTIRTRNSRICSLLFQQLLNDIIAIAKKRSIKVIRICNQNLDPEKTGFLSLFGFEQNGSEWIKVVLMGQCLLKNLSEEPLLNSHIDFAALNARLASLDHEEQKLLKLQVERKLWPAKLLDIDLPVYVIPIKPYWASQLFDYHLANTNLFGSKAELTWSKENVYYRNVKPVSEITPGRILWYLSTDVKSVAGRQNGIVACSYLDEVHIDKAKKLYQKFKGFGIYEWKHVFATAKENLEKDLKVLKFSDTEVFDNIIQLSTINEIFNRHGKPSSSFPSPVKVSNEIFHDLYKLGIKQ